MEFTKHQSRLNNYYESVTVNASVMCSLQELNTRLTSSLQSLNENLTCSLRKLNTILTQSLHVLNTRVTGRGLAFHVRGSWSWVVYARLELELEPTSG